ncbi:signal transduction histidine kinase [Metabacillus malikii]|uniref:histidine kinase n=1 Tax=Metabacillus malikii TaxID=1504265 RepID=A0ABT9ZJ36_9BACI|nr:signal transduction histidine kinase [Metabacillus malikii]
MISKLHPKRNKDLISTTQRRLTRIYSSLLILFLLLFVIIVYTVLHVTILKSTENELASLVATEADVIEEYLETNQRNNFRGIDAGDLVIAGVNQSFYYVLNEHGELLMGDETDKGLHSQLLKLLSGRINDGHNLFKETVHLNATLPNSRKHGEFHHHEPEQTITLMIASDTITYNGQFIGKLYIGKDVTFIYTLFNWVLVILVGLGIMFFGVAIFISHKMSKKAMIPITSAFTRQREFVADASHELRTPLAVLLSSIDAIDMTIESKKDDFTESLLLNMRSEVNRMTNLVSDLLALARSDSGTFDLNLETVDLKTLAENAFTSLRPLAKKKQLSMNLFTSSSLLVVADSNRLSQLIYILLDNAMKYTPNGGEVILQLSKVDSTICIVVQDSGIGIAKDELKQIFERFYRADKSRTRTVGGHGLGLSIAKSIVSSHKGSINVTSEIDRGSTFTVIIPVEIST